MAPRDAGLSVVTVPRTITIFKLTTQSVFFLLLRVSHKVHALCLKPGGHSYLRARVCLPRIERNGAWGAKWFLYIVSEELMLVRITTSAQLQSQLQTETQVASTLQKVMKVNVTLYVDKGPATNGSGTLSLPSASASTYASV